MPKLYTRNQGGIDRDYADLLDIGGGQMALEPTGSKRATTSETKVIRLFAKRMGVIEERDQSERPTRPWPYPVFVVG